MLLVSYQTGEQVPYRFTSASNVYEFVRIEYELDHLHQYCYEIQQAVASALRRENQTLDKLKASPEDTYLEEMVQQDEVWGWERCNDSISNGTILMLILATVEQHLKFLTSDSHERPVRITTTPGQSKIDAYLQHISTSKNLDLEIPKSARAAMNEARKLRNAFAHGDLELIEESLNHLDPTRAFAAVRDLYNALEAAMYG
jgi:hypothetical protein